MLCRVLLAISWPTVTTNLVPPASMAAMLGCFVADMVMSAGAVLSKAVPGLSDL
jgi:hypothetical protein